MERKVPKRRIEKIVISGNVIEYYRYLKPLNVEPREHDIEKCKETSEGKRDRNLYRARADLRRAIWCNTTDYTKFVTLTYKDTVLDQDQVLYDWKQFIKNLRRKGYKVPYIYITEHQKKRGLKEGNEGCLHIHAVLFTDDFISADVINACWGKGRTEIKALRSIKNLGAYVCKYLTKEEFDLYHKHSYHLSRGLKKPEVLTTDGYIGQWRDMYSNIHENTKVTYSNATEFVYAGADGSIQSNTILYEQGILD